MPVSCPPPNVGTYTRTRSEYHPCSAVGSQVISLRSDDLVVPKLPGYGFEWWWRLVLPFFVFCFVTARVPSTGGTLTDGSVVRRRPGSAEEHHYWRPSRGRKMVISLLYLGPFSSIWNKGRLCPWIGLVFLVYRWIVFHRTLLLKNPQETQRLKSRSSSFPSLLDEFAIFRFGGIERFLGLFCMNPLKLENSFEKLIDGKTLRRCEGLG